MENNDKNFFNCACFTLLYSYDTPGGCYVGDERYSYSCDCYETCYACNMAFYGTLNGKNQQLIGVASSEQEKTCICNQQCYQEGGTCTCNATCHLEVRECECNQKRYGCGINEDCSCNERCDGYHACLCDFQAYGDTCRQCYATTYDKNSPSYNCPCDLTCDNYAGPNPTCNCDGKYQTPKIVKCEINTIEKECGQSYSNNGCSSYINSRYY